MLKSIFFDEITLWWDKAELSREADLYKLYLDGKYFCDTDNITWSSISYVSEE